MISRLSQLHARVFGQLEGRLDGWFLGLLARFAFAAVLLVYYLNSAATKVGDGVLGFFSVGANAWFQILPPVVEAYGYDVSQVPFFPWGIVVFAGTYAEFVLPVVIVLGLFTRLASLGMIGFIVVQSYVDIAFHGVDDKTIGAWFDRFSDAAILDQRLLWVFLLLTLVVKGAGAVSLDWVLRRIVPAMRASPDRAPA
ncbi:MAG: DoxX family protein [Kiloniellaceae bacterium]